MPTPLPLPAGWTDTGFSRSVSSTASGQLTRLFDESLYALDGKIRPMGGNHNQLNLGHARFYDDDQEPAGNPNKLNIRVEINTPAGTTTHLAEQIPETTVFFPHPDTTLDRPNSSVYTVTETEGPFRMGCRWVVINEAADLPHWATNYRLEFAWFRDSNTGGSIEVSCPGGTFNRSWITGTDPPSQVVTPIGFILFGFGRADGGEDHQYAAFPTLSADGVDLDTSGLLLSSPTNPNVRLRGNIGEVVGSGVGVLASVSATANAPFRITEDLSVLDTNGVDVAAKVLDPDANVRTTPYVATRALQVVNWPIIQPALSGDRSYLIQAAWCLAQDPPRQTDDRQLLLQMPPPRQIANNGGEYRFYPVTLAMVSSTDWQRPDGGRPSDWVSSDVAKLTVAEHADYTEIHVETAGATARRTLNTAYPARIGVNGLDDPSFGFGAYENQHRQAGEDVFSWGSWAYMDWRVQGPGGLLLTVEGYHYRITDNYLTLTDDRKLGYEVEQVPYEVTYVLPVSGLDNPPSKRLDLNFPASAERSGVPLPLPFAHGQVRRVTLSGFQPGVYLLKSAVLAASSVNLKAIYPHQKQRDDYGGIHWSTNGSNALMNHGDQAYKAPEPATATQYGGALRIINIIESPADGVHDAQYSLQDSVTRMGGVEGMTVAWDQTVFDTACKDPDGHSIGAGLAQWLLPVLGETFFPNFQPPCSVVVGEVRIVNGFGFYIRGRAVLGGSVVALAITDGGERAEAGSVVKAIRDDTGAEVGTRGTTDPDGFVVVNGVPFQGSLSVHLEEA